MNAKEIIEEMARVICPNSKAWTCKACNWGSKPNCDAYKNAEKLINEGYRNCEDKVVLDREEFEKIKSLYDCGSGYMTSSIGDLPLTVEGLRKAVDEITRLNRVEAELQELNAKYYNEAKDLRRENQQLKKQVAELEDKLENGTLMEINKPFIKKTKDGLYLICKAAVMVVEDFDTKAEAEAKLKELKGEV